MGVLSYSLYLLHYAVLFAAERNLPGLAPLLQGLVALAVSLGLAWIIYVTIERPFARLRRRLTD